MIFCVIRVCDSASSGGEKIEGKIELPLVISKIAAKGLYFFLLNNNRRWKFNVSLISYFRMFPSSDRKELFLWQIKP